MKKTKKARTISNHQSTEQCQLYRNLEQFTERLNYLRDAEAIKKDRLRAAPPHLLDVVF